MLFPVPILTLSVRSVRFGARQRQDRRRKALAKRLDLYCESQRRARVTIVIGDLAVVAEWLAAANDEDAGRLEALSSVQVEIVGPRGAGLLPRSILGEWLTRAGFRS